MNDVERHIEGKTIRKAEVDGFGIRLHLSDGTVFDYDASDGGHSLWEVTLENDVGGFGSTGEQV